MSSQRISIPTNELSIGMYVAGLDRPWLETPFLFQGCLAGTRLVRTSQNVRRGTLSFLEVEKTIHTGMMTYLHQSYFEPDDNFQKKPAAGWLRV